MIFSIQVCATERELTVESVSLVNLLRRLKKLQASVLLDAVGGRQFEKEKYEILVSIGEVNYNKLISFAFSRDTGP